MRFIECFGKTKYTYVYPEDHVSLKKWWLFTRLYGIITHNTIRISTAVKTYILLYLKVKLGNLSFWMLNAVVKIISKYGRKRRTTFFGRIHPVVKQHINTLYHNWMKSTEIFTDGQPRIINKYKILKHKILKNNANIHVHVYFSFRFVIPRCVFAKWGRGWVCQNTTVVVSYLLGWLWPHVSAVFGHLP